MFPKFPLQLADGKRRHTDKPFRRLKQQRGKESWELWGPYRAAFLRADCESEISRMDKLQTPA
jgi:hypothetical protein